MKKSQKHHHHHVSSRIHQVKSRFYYIFWGTATVAVVLGQLYVGTGYRLLYRSMDKLLDKVDGVLLHKDGTPYGDML